MGWHLGEKNNFLKEENIKIKIILRNIKLGEILCVERPSIFYISPDSESDLCHLSTRYLAEKRHV